MLIASKYQEIYPPEIKDFVYVADKAYNKAEILKMEGDMLCTLQFKITVPTTLIFFERFSRMASLDKKTSFLCNYIIELALSDYNMVKYYPSVVARAAIQLASEILKKEDKALLRNMKQDQATVKLCCNDLLVMLKGAEKSHLKVIKRKFSSLHFLEVAKIKISSL